MRYLMLNHMRYLKHDHKRYLKHDHMRYLMHDHMRYLTHDHMRYLKHDNIKLINNITDNANKKESLTDVINLSVNIIDYSFDVFVLIFAIRFPLNCTHFS